ncbi:hypothetical protein LTS18_014954, partial [Coniosporium uncinatum]
IRDASNGTSHSNGDGSRDPIPSIYKPLIERFWPGPLTIILPTPSDSVLATEVTAGLKTFGARIPRDLLALSLIKLADRPIAAPSANASTKPSPTAAEHVKEDLDGRIGTILDGGPCDVGVESTVVDGLSHPPAILRPGGITLEQLRACPGWEDVRIGYQNVAQKGGSAPRAPGMKYRHYSPKAPVILYEANTSPVEQGILDSGLGGELDPGVYGVIRTKTWRKTGPEAQERTENAEAQSNGTAASSVPASSIPWTQAVQPRAVPQAQLVSPEPSQHRWWEVWDIGLGPATEDIARGLFSALRELDRKGVLKIFVEGIDDSEGDVAAAVMNRLRKAAEVHVSS